MEADRGEGSGAVGCVRWRVGHMPNNGWIVDVAGEAEIKISVRGGTVQADVCLRAAALWADGYEHAATRWIDTVSWWLLGARVELDGAHALGWESKSVPIAVDYHGLSFTLDDIGLFVGLRDTQAYCKGRELQTLYVGGERSPARWALYSKTEEIKARRGGDASIYAATWAHAPGYQTDREITRAELRLQGDGLTFVDCETREVIDLRDPAALADEAALAMVWSAIASQRRLVLPGRSRKRRAETDPRWTAIIDAARRAPPRLRQAREVRVAACGVLQMARRRRAVGAIHGAAAIHGVVLDSPAAVGEFAGALARLEPREHMSGRQRAIATLERNRASWGDGPREGALMLQRRGMLPAGVRTVPLTDPSSDDAFVTEPSEPAMVPETSEALTSGGRPLVAKP
jgi:hypothetical protein